MFIPLIMQSVAWICDTPAIPPDICEPFPITEPLSFPFSTVQLLIIRLLFTYATNPAVLLQELEPSNSCSDFISVLYTFC